MFNVFSTNPSLGCWWLRQSLTTEVTENEPESPWSSLLCNWKLSVARATELVPNEAVAKRTRGIRSYLSTMRKQGHTMLRALSVVFLGRLLPGPWGI